MTKILIFDASTIISFVINGLEDLFPKLKEKTGVKFIITSTVKFETIKRPIQTKKYELGAIKIKNLLESGVFESPEIFGVNDEQIEQETKNILDKANKMFWANNHPIHLIEKGEASCLALYNILKNDKKIDNIVMAVDERTTRMLGERPENLRKILESKLHTKIDTRGNYSDFEGYNFIRSCEMVYIAYKKGLVALHDGNQLLDALLYASKFAGCSVSREEIEELKRM